MKIPMIPITRRRHLTVSSLVLILCVSCIVEGVADLYLDDTDRVTNTNKSRKNKNTPLVPSGLLGPVTFKPVN